MAKRRKKMDVRCKVCKKHFNFESKLKRHMRSHAGEKPYKCKQCEERFNQSLDLTRHMRVHCGFKPYNCAHCGKGFNKVQHLERHIRILVWSDTSVPNVTRILTMHSNWEGTCWITIRNHANVLDVKESRLQRIHYGVGGDRMMTACCTSAWVEFTGRAEKEI